MKKLALSMFACVFFTGCNQEDRYPVEQKSKPAAKEASKPDLKISQQISPPEEPKNVEIILYNSKSGVLEGDGHEIHEPRDPKLKYHWKDGAILVPKDGHIHFRGLWKTDDPEEKVTVYVNGHPTETYNVGRFERNVDYKHYVFALNGG